MYMSCGLDDVGHEADLLAVHTVSPGDLALAFVEVLTVKPRDYRHWRS